MSIKDNSYGIADLQDKMLDIFKYFDSICTTHGLKYWACAGTCIGAVRHGGFIPWDDDLDVIMPRYDYEKLWNSWNEISTDPKYKLCRTDHDKNYRHRVMQIVDTTTTFINRRCVNDDIEHGVYIDILPIDAAAPGKISKLLQAFYAVMFSVYNIQVLPEFHGNKIMEIGTKFLLNLVKDPEKRYKIWKKYEKKLSKYDTRTASEYISLLGRSKLLMKPMPSKWFKTVRVPFEDTEINIPVDYDKYLKTTHGEYMELPPENKRAVQHHTVLIDLNKPYTDYKGIYYCVKN